MKTRTRLCAALAATVTVLSLTGLVAPTAAHAAAADACPTDEASARAYLTAGSQFGGPYLDGCDFTGMDLSDLNIAPLAAIQNSDFTDVDLSGTNFSDGQFVNVDFTGADLSAARGSMMTLFTGSNFTDANLSNAIMTNVSFDHATMTRARLTGGRFNYAYFDRASMVDAILDGATLNNAYFSNADLTNADLSGTSLTDASLDHANLTNADLSNAGLSRARFTNANLTNANLSNSYPDRMTDFGAANLTGANFTNADLSGEPRFTTAASVTGTNWTGVDFTSFTRFSLGSFYDLDLTGANFTNANLAGAFTDGNIWTGVTWTGATCMDAKPYNAHVGLACDGALDDTAPTLTTLTVTGTQGNSPWYLSDVVISWACIDDVALVTCPDNTIVTTEGADQTVISGNAIDAAGNAAAGTRLVSIDKTAPTITAQINGTKNPNGTYLAPVSITYVCDDAISGISSCPDETFLSSLNGNHAATGTAIDNAGNSTPLTTTVTITGGINPFTVNTPVISGVTAGRTYPYGTNIKPTCTATVTYTDAVTLPDMAPNATCTGTTQVSRDGRTHTYKATATYTNNGYTGTSTKSVTWYTTAKPVAKPAPPKIKFPTGLTTKSGHPVVTGGKDYTLTLTVPRGGTPKWLYSVKTNAKGTLGKPTEVYKGLQFKKVKSTALTTTWSVTYSPTTAQSGQYRKFAIVIDGVRYTAIAYVK
jgi:uncharacterized protein YjbI with pentapeptide repeats